MFLKCFFEITSFLSLFKKTWRHCPQKLIELCSFYFPSPLQASGSCIFVIILLNAGAAKGLDGRQINHEVFFNLNKFWDVTSASIPLCYTRDWQNKLLKQMTSWLSQSIGLFIAVSAQFILRKNVKFFSIQTNQQTKQITNWFRPGRSLSWHAAYGDQLVEIFH